MGERILLIDDDPAFVETSQAVLEKSGYEVIVAYSAEDGWQCAVKETPDLIVLDVMMESKTSGITLVYRLKTCKQTAEVPILMVTSVYEELPWLYEPEDFWNLMAAYLEKPVKPKTLLEWVGRTTGRRASAQEKGESGEQPFSSNPSAG